MSYRKIGAPVADAVASSRSTPFLRTAAAAAGGAAQLLGRENPSKIGRLAHYNLAQCGVGGRWRTRALHACMCALTVSCSCVCSEFDADQGGANNWCGRPVACAGSACVHVYTDSLVFVHSLQIRGLPRCAKL